MEPAHAGDARSVLGTGPGERLGHLPCPGACHHGACRARLPARRRVDARALKLLLHRRRPVAALICRAVPPQVCVLSFQGNGSHRNEVLSLDWSPVDPDLLLSGGMDNHIKIW